MRANALAGGARARIWSRSALLAADSLPGVTVLGCLGRQTHRKAARARVRQKKKLERDDLIVKHLGLDLIEKQYGRK